MCTDQTGVTWAKGDGFTAAGEVTLRACARAAKATGLPITTHTEVEERIGLAQCALFEEEGVDMNRVYIGRKKTLGCLFFAPLLRNYADFLWHQTTTTRRT